MPQDNRILIDDVVERTSFVACAEHDRLVVCDTESGSSRRLQLPFEGASVTHMDFAAGSNNLLLAGTTQGPVLYQYAGYDEPKDGFANQAAVTAFAIN